jgi:hypothetical protein
MALAVLVVPAACVIGSGNQRVTIGRVGGPSGAETLVTAGGVRIPTSPERIAAIYARVSSQFETISCTRTITTRSDTRSRAPRPPRTGPITSASTWNEWFEGHTSERSRTRFCTYGASALQRGGQLASGRGPQDSTIHVVTTIQRGVSYPWETLVIQGDTARIGNSGLEYVPHSVYAYLHLLEAQGRLALWLPDAAGADALARELAILDATADAYLLSRGGLGGDPQPLLEELLYARQAGRLEAFLLTRNPNAFPVQRGSWLVQNPDAEEDYLRWHRETFDLRR